jgi:hypothetical protein
MKTIDFSYFIERYIVGEMDQTEKNWFEKELVGNESLKKEVMLRKRVDNAMIQHDLISLRNKLVTLEKERKEKFVASAGKKTIGIRYAAAIAGFMLLGSLIAVTLQHQNPDKLYSKLHQTYEYQGNTRSGAIKTDPDYEKAIQLYESEKYPQAAILFTEFLKKQPANMEAHFMNGVSQMENNNFPVAKSSFATVINDNNNLFVDNAKWHLAQCFIKTKEIPEARQQLIAIINSESAYKNLAKKALRKL